MRVIAGRYRGRIISTVKDRSVRPATDRVRQTIFDMLATRLTLEGAAVLDLFAGSGSLGIEALSRGARHVTFVENNALIARSIRQNLLALGCTTQSDVVAMEAVRYIESGAGSFDLIFADPPYAYERTTELPGSIVGGGLLRPHGLLIIEHTKETAFVSTTLYKAGPVKKFGTTVITFFQGTAT
jgi:16S rRNA (guanine966-N2)-methyltransferase